MSTVWLHSGEPYIVQPQDEVMEPFHEDEELRYVGGMFFIAALALTLAAVWGVAYAMDWL